MPKERAASEMDPVALIASSNAILPGPTWTFSAKSMRIRITGVIALVPLCECATRTCAPPSYENFSSGLNTTSERRILTRPITRGVSMSTTFFLNGQSTALDADPNMPLLWAIREVAGLHGTKFGCGMAMCGACTVHLDGQPIRSCVMPLSSVAGRKITTIEGLQSKQAKAVQAAWIDLQVPQCGYCQSGQIMAATALLEKNSAPSDADIDGAMSGNICRCATYPRIRAAIHEAAQSAKVPA